MLPKCLNQIQTPRYIQKIKYTDTNEFLMELQDILSSDCWACVLDGEVCWNDFKINTFSQKIYESMTRDYIINNPKILISTTGVLDVYMYGTKTVLYKILINNGTYLFTFYEL